MFKVLAVGKNGDLWRSYCWDSKTKKFRFVWVLPEGLKDIPLGFEPRDYEHLWGVVGKFNPWLRFKEWVWCPEVKELTVATLESLLPEFADDWKPPVILPVRNVAVPMKSHDKRATLYVDVSSQCLRCANLNPGYGISCTAYPDGIHPWIVEGRWDHRKVFPLQVENKIVFKPRKE